ncbi:hypothetical protein XELAEV_18030601mg [Xenopus laevis]|uniref:Uncharacterized protein n=1 Tax=Xenopus laevis TaxID=8355 RepID=A0A974HEW3_XENLA|nr:hypothetical protein XELAEV_18030601mg [Xenopus laevis]
MADTEDGNSRVSGLRMPALLQKAVAQKLSLDTIEGEIWEECLFALLLSQPTG